MPGANKGFGTTISIGVVPIGVLTSIGEIEISADTIETTVLDSTDSYRTYIQGMRDAGELSLAGFFDLTDSGQTALKTAFDNGTLDTYTITFPAAIGGSWTISGIVTSYKTGEANLDDPLAFELTLKISGKPNLGATASAGLSALTFTQTDGSTALTGAALTPTFANGTYIYAFSFNTQTAFKVKATASSHSIKLYVDGVFSENLTSGSAGTSISIGASATKKIDLIVYESGKNPKTYTATVTRTA